MTSKQLTLIRHRLKHYVRHAEKQTQHKMYEVRLKAKGRLLAYNKALELLR